MLSQAFSAALSAALLPQVVSVRVKAVYVCRLFCWSVLVVVCLIILRVFTYSVLAAVSTSLLYNAMGLSGSRQVNVAGRRGALYKCYQVHSSSILGNCAIHCQCQVL